MGAWHGGCRDGVGKPEQGKGLEDELDKPHSLGDEARGLEDGADGGLLGRDCMHCRSWDH